MDNAIDQLFPFVHFMSILNLYEFCVGRTRSGTTIRPTCYLRRTTSVITETTRLFVEQQNLTFGTPSKRWGWQMNDAAEFVCCTVKTDENGKRFV